MNSSKSRSASIDHRAAASKQRRAVHLARSDHADVRLLAMFAGIALPTGWALLLLPVAFDVPAVAALLATNVLALLAPALVLTARGPAGSAGVRRLLADAVKLPRPRYWLLSVLAIPGPTWLLAALLGAGAPVDIETLVAFVLELLAGALIINIWEELAWTGFVQRRATARWGAVRGAGVTAGLFAGIHLPLVFYDEPTADDVLLGVALLAVTGVGLRMLMGGLDRWTGGSLLTIGFVHSSFNATREVVAPDHDWIRLAVTLLLGVLVAAAVTRRTRPGPDGDRRRADAQTWVGAVAPSRGAASDQRRRGPGAVRVLRAAGSTTVGVMRALAARARRGWRVSTSMAAAAAIAVAVTSLLTPTAAPAIDTAWAVPALLGGLVLLGGTWRPEPAPGRDEYHDTRWQR